MSEHVILLSVPGLRVGDISAEATPTLHRWASDGAVATLVPTFPCVTSPVQASMLTGTPPAEHGVIANGFYHRDRREVEFWVAEHDIIQRPTIWEIIRRRRPDLRSAVWHAQNIKRCPADFIVTPAPIHDADGTTRLWCYSKPEGLYQTLLDEFGHFPLQHYWGPLANIESTRWTIQAACRLIERQAPNFHYIYIPHLDYAAQKFGPDSEPARQSLAAMDAELATLDAFVADSPLADDVVYLAASEYAMTPVTGAIFPNRALREAGLLKTHSTDDGEVIDFAASDAFAMVDHQFAHVYAKRDKIESAADVLRRLDGLDAVYVGRDRQAVGLDHPRCGEILLISSDDRWLAYYWWFNDADAPPFARTVDIHRKPGYDPVEQFWDRQANGVPLDASLVRGSHGVPATEPRHAGAFVCSRPTDALGDNVRLRDVDVQAITLRLLGIAPETAPGRP